MVSETTLTPQNDRISEWIASTCPLTPPPDDESKPRAASLKRKRAMSLPPAAPSSYRSDSPKRRRVEDTDEVRPEQSASQLGGGSVTALNDRNTFSLPISRASSIAKRSSPTREKPIMLRSAYPPIVVESLNGLKRTLPQHVSRLGDRLAEGTDFNFIPQNLESVIKGDPDVGLQTIRAADFDRSDVRSIEELSPLWNRIKTIFGNAHDCKDGGRDENAWCDDVVRPLIDLAMELYGGGKWWLQSVQSQSINPLYLSTVAVGERRKPMDRKTDYVFSYSHRHPEISALYDLLDANNTRDIGPTLDTFTKRTALFSGFEVKPASGDHTDAELRMSIWIAASLRKKQELLQDAQISVDPTLIVEPSFTIVGHDHSVYYACPRDDLVSGRNGIHVVGPDLDRFERLSTNSIRGIFRLLKFYGNLMNYGSDQSDDGYWGGFLRPVLDKLARPRT